MMEAELFGCRESWDASDEGEEGQELGTITRNKRSPKPIKPKRKKKIKNTVRVNLSACKYDILRMVLKKLGWREVGDEDDWQLYWTDTSVSMERVMKLKKTQKINHFCGMLEICRKKKLASNFARMAKVAVGDYTFHPMTYNLPDELDDFLDVLKSKKKKTFILKPDAGCQGKGIRLAQSTKDVHKALEELGTTTNIVAQKYVAKPFLIDGLKFDLRIYIMIASCDPLRMYIFEEGLARFCTEKYEAPRAGNLATAYMHLTNYAVNKRNENFQFNTDEDADDEGSKWSLSALREWMDSHGYDYDQVWGDICDIAVKTVISIQPLLGHNYRSVLGYENEGFSCFEVLGMDIMLDSKLKPWLIECNHSPSFGVDTPLDLNIKEALITDTLHLASIDARAIKKQKKEDKKAAESRLYGRSKGLTNLRRAMTPEEVKVYRASVLEKREKWEKEILDGSKYSIIYPSPVKELQQRYEHLLTLSSQLFERSAPSRTNATINAIASKKKAEMEESDAGDKKKPAPTKSTSSKSATPHLSNDPRGSSARRPGRNPANVAVSQSQDARNMPVYDGEETRPSRAGWAAAELAGHDSLESWQNTFPARPKSPPLVSSTGYDWPNPAECVDSGKAVFDALEISGEDSSTQGAIIYESFSPLVQSSPRGGSRETRSFRRFTAVRDQAQPSTGRTSRRAALHLGAPASADTEFGARSLHSFTHGSDQVQRPVSGSFPRRQSGRVRAVGSVHLNQHTTGSRPYSGVSSRPGSGTGVYTIQQGSGSVACTTSRESEGHAIGMAPMDDILDNYMQTYGVKRLWSGTGGANTLPMTGSTARQTHMQQDAEGGSTQALAAGSKISYDESSRFSGLTIRGIRPR